MSSQGAGWYDDGNGRQRWWDGSKWGPLADAIEEAASSQSSISDAAKAAYAEARQSLPDLARQAVAERYPAAESYLGGAQSGQTESVAVRPAASGSEAGESNPTAAVPRPANTRATQRANTGKSGAKNSVTKPRKIGVAVVLTLIVGIISLLTSAIPLFGALVGSLAVILALIALIREQSKVLSIIGMIMGIIAIFVSLLVGLAVWSAIGG